MTATATSPACPTWRPAQVAAYLGCCVREVWRRHAADPTFPRAHKVSHRVTLFVRADVEAWNGRRLAATGGGR
jgi:predicted DNA-binding transcriptional regulator AlpA